MRKNGRKLTKFKLLFLIGLGLFLTCIVTSSIFITITIYDAKKNLSSVVKMETSPTHLKPSVFEEKTSVDHDDFKLFYNMSSSDLPFHLWVDENSENQNIIKEKNQITFNKTVTIPPLVTNDCKDVYCFQHIISFEKIPPSVWKGLIGIEDLRFVTHNGIDFKAIIRAFIVDLKEMKMVQGGSTLTQQLIKNIFLSQEKTFLRKLKEWILSIYLENYFTKEEIINAYMNEVFWGAIQGIKIKGIYAASQFYFSKRPEELDDYEASILISLLKGPSYYSPLTNLNKLKERSDLVYEKLSTLNLIAFDVTEKWNLLKWDQYQNNLKNNQTNKLIYSLWMSQDEENTLMDSFEKFILMKSALKTLNITKKKYKAEDFAFKIVATDPFCAQDCRYKDQYFYSKYERDKVRAIEFEEHQIGSIIKPIIYSLFYKLGKTPRDLVETKPFSIKLKSGMWSPKDSSKASVPIISLEEALQKSRNIPLIRTAYEIGPDLLEQNLLEYFPKLMLPLKEYPSQLLGTMELNLKNLSEIYKKFINQECLELKKGEKLLEELILYQLSDPQKTTLSLSVNEKLAQFKFFSKTGTTNNGLDNWFIAYDSKFLYVIWFGLEGNRINKKFNLSGANTSFKIFQDFITNRGKRFIDLTCGDIEGFPRQNN